MSVVPQPWPLPVPQVAEAVAAMMYGGKRERLPFDVAGIADRAGDHRPAAGGGGRWLGLEQLAVAAPRAVAHCWPTSPTPAASRAASAGRPGRVRRAGRRARPGPARPDRLTMSSLAALPMSSTWLTGMVSIVEAATGLGDRALAAEAYRMLLPYAGLPATPSLAVSL